MRLIAFELSSRRSSIALVRDGKMEAEESWESPQSQKFFEVFPSLLNRARVSVNEIDIFAVGRGPGAFSGIRVAVTAAKAFALPTQKAVFALSSGEALAHSVLKESAKDRVAVVGDARRGTLWYGVFSRDAQEIPWSLTNHAELDKVVPADALRVSPDWDRISPDIKDTSRWITTGKFPDASSVAALVIDRIKRGIPSDPVEPIYMHPPV